jgi:cytolysin (calcineurin-like family phosphatase)
MSAYVKLSTMEFPRYIGDIEIDPSGMVDYADVVDTLPPSINYERETLEYGVPEQRDGVWYVTWVVNQYPDEVGASRVRAKRNQLLAETDWTQVADAPVDKASWATYRQALRDITTQSGFPWEVTWPDAP